MPPKTVFDVVKTHLRLPINRDYEALKQALRDWYHYSTQTPLQSKPTFPAELLITITRDPRHPQKAHPNSVTAKLTHGDGNARRASPSRSRRWSLWKSPSTATTSSSSSGHNVTAESDDAAPFVYRKVVPLHVWTSVLPWEMQRGLSFSTLTLPEEEKTKEGAATATLENSQTPAAASNSVAREKETDAASAQSCASARAVEMDDDEDPYGVVSSAATVAAATSSDPASSLAALAKPSSSFSTTAVSVTPPAPAMLFLSDVPATQAYGIGFWSGAILQPIDVLFVAPTLPTSVDPSSASFEKLREQDGLAAIEDNVVSRQVLTRYFPLQEIHPSSSWSSPASSVTFRVHSFSHLDPVPSQIHPSRLDSAEGRAAEAGGKSFTATPDAPYSSPREAPRYIFEVPRHTLQPAVAAAVKESQQLLRQRSGRQGAARGPSMDLLRGSRRGRDDSDDGVSIDLVVNFSDALRQDLFAKAQLCVEYVSLIEDAIAHYTRELSTDRTATAVAADPLPQENADGSSSSSTGRDDNVENRPIKVWLSEHESRWMTPAELRRAGSSDNRQDERDSPDADSDEAPASYESAKEVVVDRGSEDHPLTSSNASSVSSAVAQAAARAVGATAAQPGAVSAARSISLQSPMLQDETEGRPSYLAPSFVGRHESATLQQSAVVLSADKLARYPQTHSHMPQLPPIDYELYDLCMRLGVGQRPILYYYHERILKEWRTELQRRRRQRQSRGGGGEGVGAVDTPAAAQAIDVADVERMVALVRDRSLQLSPELVSLVEAVAAA